MNFYYYYYGDGEYILTYVLLEKEQFEVKTEWVYVVLCVYDNLTVYFLKLFIIFYK